MKFSRREVEVLDCLVEKQYLAKELSVALNIKPANLSKLLKKLVSYSLIRVSREKRGKLVSPDYAVWFPFRNVKSKFSIIKLTDVLVGYAPFLLSFMKTKEQFTAKDLDLPIATAKRILKKLRSLGLVHMPLKGVYVLRKEAEIVAEFCRQLVIRIYLDLADKELKSIQQFYFSFNSAKELEAVFVTDKINQAKNYYLTSYSVFHQYGAQLISSGKYYYANKKPTIEDVAVHTLAISRDARVIAYVTALMTKNKFNYSKLLEKKQRFDISKQFLRNLVEFVRSKGEKTVEGFPNWSEVEGVING